MKRYKFEYMYLNMPVTQKKKMVQELDPKGEFMFTPLICKFLIDPDTKDPEILDCLPGWGEPEELENIKRKYREQYAKINELCKENKTYPFFKDPNNLKECEETRLDLIKPVYEDELNEFFGVNDFYDYKPPVYEKS